jgi:hypothetical protein
MGYSKGANRQSDRILDSIDRARNRESLGPTGGFDRQATARELNTDIPGLDAMQSERVRRIFKTLEAAYVATAQSQEIRRLAARFQAIGDISEHRAKGDVTISVQYLDHERYDDVGIAPFEVTPTDMEEAKKASGSSRADANALRILRERLRNGVQAAFAKLEPRVKDAVRARADLGHIGVQVTMDLRPEA